MKKKTLTVRNFQRNPKTSQQNQNEKKKKNLQGLANRSSGPDISVYGN